MTEYKMKIWSECGQLLRFTENIGGMHHTSRFSDQDGGRVYRMIGGFSADDNIVLSSC
jgi:hypothetical protein